MQLIRGAHGKAEKNEERGEPGSLMTYEQIIGFGLTVLGLRRDDLDWMTPVEFGECVKAYNVQRDADVRHRYEISRFQAWLTLAPHLKNQSQADIFRFPWEKDETKKGKLIEWQEIPTIKN